MNGILSRVRALVPDLPFQQDDGARNIHGASTSGRPRALAATPPPSSKVKLTYDKHGWPTTFRVAGSPAGSFPHGPWWHCMFCDPYERICVWTHLLPGLALLALCVSTALSSHPGHAAVSVFAACACSTHLFSALTHVWPDDHYLEKLDHLGIAALAVGTPISTLLARNPGEPLLSLYEASLCMFVAAFCPPLLRTAAWSVCIAYIYLSHFDALLSPHVAAELALYGVGAIAFLWNGGHERWLGLQDHHILHYCATVSCCLHVAHLYSEVSSRAGDAV